MADTLEVDSQWVVATLTTICTQVAVLPNIEKHLAQQNDSIAKQQELVNKHEERLKELERIRKAANRRWAIVLNTILKLMVAIAAPLMLLHVFGIIQ